METGRRVVVTGGAGFIGSRIALQLAARGCDVCILDIADCPAELRGKTRYVRCDITNREALRDAFRDAELIVHCAARLGLECMRAPDLGWATNIAGTVNVVSEAIATSTRPRIVFLSTGTVYASPARQYPLSELSAIEGRGLYAQSKVAGEAIVNAAAQAQRIRALIFRLFTVYGEGPASSERGHFVASWVEKARAGQPLTIYGEGEQTVDLTHVSDVSRAVADAATLPLSNGECRIYNLGGGQETPVAEIAQWIRDCDPAVRVLHIRDPGYAPFRQFADIARAKQDLRYEPSAPPAELIKRLFLSALRREAS